MSPFFRYILVGILFLSVAGNGFAQAEKRKQLEQKRQALREEIREINTLLSSNQKERQSVLTKATDLDRKIRATEQLIRTTNQEVNLLTGEINDNLNKITDLRETLKELKEDYAGMIQKSYKGRSKQSRIMFLFSSANFLQAYKRLQYMKQYANYREKQGEKIKEQTEELQQLNKDLAQKREDQKKLVEENRKTQQRLRTDKSEQDKLIATINRKGSTYRKQIEQRQQEISRIDAEIQRLIREAIAAENKKTGSTSTSAFELTPEAKQLAANFEANRGRLPWPLKSGRITRRFGENPSPIAKNVTVHSNGIRIETNEEEPALGVFKGKVLMIQSIPGANKAIYVQHGNYISVYNNLKALNVKRGDEVETGQILGQVGHSTDTHRPALYFYIYKNNTPLDPLTWILRR